ncbi:MAG: 23S rRNA (adenine(2503)-C(2))-methyltransferase RlmN [Planctomycetaceae bacterium]|jgi:23S rRNA (adenine2503-C2)-methyltransferase|nr:23S rRNA (adenine(2503)-C(2))-methyltransferase RlmN [Phycisphaerales bacterium]MCE2653390.1 23S rRNA (adenine(2503)-C(2))-methyltransferase RlmN [Planctomycetaceae bacterium]
MRHPKHHFFAFTPEELKAWCGERGMPAFRATQLLKWVYERGVTDPAEMTDLSKRDREAVAAEMTFTSAETVTHKVATDGVQKLLLEWWDGDGPAKPAQAGPAAGEERDGGMALPVLGAGGGKGGDTTRQTECVLIPTMTRQTACISSQVGCPVGCKFCASGIGGLDANLSAGRIVEQVWRLGKLPGVGRISNVVFMGMGEPLSNFEAVTAAIRSMNGLWGLGISARKITISTVGLPKYIKRLRDEFDLPVTLALSLHAPTDELRRQLIPWAEFTTIAELLDSCQGWFEKSGREITLEYTLLRDTNDRPEHAQALAGLASSLRANVNLIRYNEVGGVPFNRPRTDDVLNFQAILQRRGVNTHIRRSRGRDIAAACGQLRHENKAKAAGREAAPVGGAVGGADDAGADLED